MSKTILLIGTLDTKGPEYNYVSNLITERGHNVLLLNAGVTGEPTIVPDISADEVAKAGDTSLVDLREQADRGAAIDVMAQTAVFWICCSKATPWWT